MAKDKKEIKHLVLGLFQERKKLKLSDLVKQYKIDLEIALEVCSELEKEGKIKPLILKNDERR